MNKGFIVFSLLACWLGIAFSQTGSDSGIYGYRSGYQTSDASDISSRQQVKYNITPLGGWINVFSEGFNNISLLPGTGWSMINNSDPLGSSGWFQGNQTFNSYDGSSNAYIAANYLNAISPGTISNWLISPHVNIVDGNELRFWTRTNTGSTIPDRLEVRMSLNGSSDDVGSTAISAGDFSELLLTINPTLTSGGYPEAWTQYTIVISGVSAPANGRFAFRYFVEDTQNNGNFIGIDRVQYLVPTSMVPLSNWAMVLSLVLMAAFSLWFFRRVLC